MARKSNKTEHVLKLISKEEDPEGTAGEETRNTEEIPENTEEAAAESPAAAEEPEDCRRYRSPEDNTVLVNIAEQLVMENIEEVMKRMNVCGCPVRRNDMEIYKNQYETDVLAALTKACVRVKAGPRHG